MSAARQNRGRFGPGNCANPNGRPRKTVSADSVIMRALNESVVITENGRRRRISKLAATAKQVANKGASGDPRSIKLALDLAMKAGEREDAAPRSVSLSQSDEEIAARLIGRIRRMVEDEARDAPDLV